VQAFIKAELSDEPRRTIEFLAERQKLLSERDRGETKQPVPFKTVPKQTRGDDDAEG
jgi:hypothetical protein